MTDENKYKTALKKRILKRFPGSIVLHLDPNECQGIPDLLVLWRSRWAALEAKKHAKAGKRPNQDYYVSQCDSMSFSRVIFPENEKEVLDEMEQSLQA